MNITGNEPYYPIVTEEVTDRYQDTPASLNNHVEASGITIRQQFAAMAMQGLLAGDIKNCIAIQQSVIIADALITELNKTEK